MVAALACPSQHPSASPSFRLDGPLPSGVRVKGDTLGFPPLTTEHSGVYVCHVSNELSSRASQVTVEVLGKHSGWRTKTRIPSPELGGSSTGGKTEKEMGKNVFGDDGCYILERIKLSG